MAADSREARQLRIAAGIHLSLPPAKYGASLPRQPQCSQSCRPRQPQGDRDRVDPTDERLSGKRNRGDSDLPDPFLLSHGPPRRGSSPQSCSA